ncbi:phage holin family protein [Salmonella enterica]
MPVSNLPGVVNVVICLVIVMALFLYRRNGAAHKPVLSWLSYLLIMGYALIPFRFLFNHYPGSDWVVVVLNLAVCVLVLWARGNVSRIIGLLRY